MHFLSKLHKNSILTGSVDSYCLVCDNYLRSEDEAFLHIEKPIHKKNMEAATTVEKFLQDRIVKVKKGYYCPFCNILLSTTTKVTIHIGNTSHQVNKGAQMLSRLGDDVILFDESAITQDSWHGLMENTCITCNIEFFDDDKHTTDRGHILTLVQSKYEFGDKYVYRKVDEDSFFCLTCGRFFTINEKLNHHENISHKQQYNSGKELKNKILKIKHTTKSTPSKSEPTNTPNGVAKSPIDNKSTEKIDIKKSELKATQSPVNDYIQLTDGKIKKPLSKSIETSTLLQNTVLASEIIKNQKKHENINGSTEAKGKSEKAPANIIDKAEKPSSILDRVDEFQRKGINIDFTWDRARCKHCNIDVPFDDAAIEQHIEEVHNFNEKINNVDSKLETKNQVQKPESNEAKTDAKKVDNSVIPKNDANKMNNTIEAKTDAKKTVNNVEPKKDIKKLDTTIVPKPDTKNTDNSGEPKKDAKKMDNTIETKTDAKKTINSFEPKIDTKKIDISIEPKTETKMTVNSVEPNNVEQKLNSKKQHMKSESSNDVKPNTKKPNKSMKQDTNKQVKQLDSNNEVKTDGKKTENATNPKTDPTKQKKSDETKTTKNELERFAKVNNIVVMAKEAYCAICKVGMTLTMTAVKKHVNTISHKDKTQSQNELIGTRVPTSKCTNSLICVETNLGIDIILNKKYFLRQHSFHCVIMEGECYKCVLCDVDFIKAGEQLSLHINKPQHKDNIDQCMLVRSLPEEFIREMAPDTYHCGYCNEVFVGWTEIQGHLSRSLHLRARHHAQWNLERCQNITRNPKWIPVSSLHAINYL